ncbi:transporter [Streptomyces sulfonofaciens]|uniref:Transporter n=1 Tax=Streptomyces sulfonofaciens TaxID=68272 RepID=A0A919G1C8_9ACTN|nr:ABC transporter permease [Streptomyces sulfonofaciens]GHH76280.1 transporter [Streptomyces sulfonofaciens]
MRNPTSNPTRTPTAGAHGAAPSPAATRAPRLSGLTWLVWRQHRAGFWTLLAATALSLAWIAYQRAGLVHHLTAEGWPGSSPDRWLEGMAPYSAALQKVAYGLGFIPVLLGVFLGAPLLAGDLENGTAKLVASQSVSPGRWLATKLGISALVVIVCTSALSAAFGWWWGPVRNESTVLGWSEGSAFDNTGPVPVALALFTLMGGVAIGMLLRRTLASMVVTFLFAVAVQVVWQYERLNLGQVVTVNTTKGVSTDAFPRLPHAALQIDQSYVSGSGETFGWSTCVHASSQQACLKKLDIVGWSVDYLPISQMSGMQWFGASVLLALTAAVTAFVFIRCRKRLV